MFVEDLSTNAFFAHGVDVRAVGWLEADHPFARGPVTAEFLTVLKAHVSSAYQVVWFMGFHECSLCPEGCRRAGLRNLLVPTQEVLYVAPELVVHYIEDHGYQPPAEFVTAVLACPKQESPEFLKLLQRFEKSWTG